MFRDGVEARDPRSRLGRVVPGGMSYRDDLDAAQLRRASLQRELADVKRKMRDLAPLRAQAQALEATLRETERDVDRARAKVPLPLLSRMKVASPCSAKWEDMSGDAHARHCAQCDKSVYDLSSLSAPEAEALLRERGQSLCVRFYRRADGTVLNADCPVGAKRKRRLQVVGGALAASLVGAGAAFAAMAGTATMGEMSVAPVPPCSARLPANVGEWEGEMTMGEATYDPSWHEAQLDEPEPELIQGGASFRPEPPSE